jgi:hypothetical protein
MEPKPRKTNDSQNRKEASLRFLEAVRGHHLEPFCARAIAWDAEGRMLSEGEVFVQPDLVKPVWGKFWPDEPDTTAMVGHQVAALSWPARDRLAIRLKQVATPPEHDGFLEFFTKEAIN